ncbi:reverse transcriptase domain-containing protein [Fructilactobacillus carniphilus]|uniref:RNA-directed DNA polymerase n=1 Tax=Fructilactobacillus carniphilus TaxID=2940297 RepID=A0ABY5BYP6_9LACO|nr:reverse transcriptase domain-containing protein [Fructilactobacillus carniphilus]USS90748.1 reverse transcriptase domain-containing protein [Fructilactobacillus carniphilus]
MKKISDFNNRNDFINYLHSVGFINQNNKTRNEKLSLSSLFDKNDELYHKAHISKKYSDEKRCLTVPDRDLKDLQKIINELIKAQLKFNSFKFEKYVQAYQDKKGIFTNAQMHRNKKYLLHLDLKNFFPTIHFGRVSGLLHKSYLFGLNKQMAFFFANILTYKGELPQGSPTSPIISNLIGKRLDQQIVRVALKFHFTYSRYADDLTFSTNDSNIIRNKLFSFKSEIYKIVNKNGFKINDKKTIISGPNVRHEVTGLSNNKRVSVTDDFYKKTRAMVNNIYVKNFFFDGSYFCKLNSEKSIRIAIQKISGRYAFIKDIEDKNRNMYIGHENGSEYNGITPTYFKEESYKNNRLGIYSGKMLSYSRFLFYKFFLSGLDSYIFCEGKTDPRYIKAAMNSLNINSKIKLIDFESQKNKNTTFKKIFSLSGGGGSLKIILEMYFGNAGFSTSKMTTNLTSYWDYFSQKIIPIRPSIILFDYEINSNNSPLSHALNFIKSRLINSQNNTIDFKDIEHNIKNFGYSHIIGNLYIATTFQKCKSSDIAIENYFPDDFLNHPYASDPKYVDNENQKERQFENAPDLQNSSVNKIEKNEFSSYVRSRINDKDLFKNFKELFLIFDKIRVDYGRLIFEKMNYLDSSSILYKFTNEKLNEISDID